MSYLSWHWSVMQNLKTNWLAVWKMAWGIWQILTRTLGSAKIGTFMGFFCSKKKMHKLKNYRGNMCNDTEEWWNIWWGIDWSFQSRHKEFDKFWLEHSKVSKICSLMGCFWPKYIMLELKKYREVIFNDTRKWNKIWRGTEFPVFKIDLRNLKAHFQVWDNFWQLKAL